MAKEEFPLDSLVWKCGPEKEKFDMVFLMGQDSGPEMMILKKETEESGLSCCFVGNGKKGSFFTKDLIETATVSKMDGHTVVVSTMHGSALQQARGVYSKHYISSSYGSSQNTVRDDRTTLMLQEDVAEIFHKNGANQGEKVNFHMFGCQIGAAQTDIPKEATATLHGGQKYLTTSNFNAEAMKDLIQQKKEKQSDPYTNFMHRITHSPETAIFVEENNGETKTHKVSAPKYESCGKEQLSGFLDEHLRESLAGFLEFRQNELGHEVGNIDDIVKNTVISEEMLKRYHELQLLYESGRPNNDKGVRYVEVLLDGGVNVNATPLEDGDTAVFAAIRAGNTNIFNKLVETPRIDLHQRERTGGTLMYKVAQVPVSEKMMDDFIFAACRYDDDGLKHGLYDCFTPLMVAAIVGNKNAVKALLGACEPELIQKRVDGEKAEEICRQRNITIPDGNRVHFGKNAEEMATACGHDEIAGMIQKKLQPKKRRGRGLQNPSSSGESSFADKVEKESNGRESNAR